MMRKEIISLLSCLFFLISSKSQEVVVLNSPEVGTQLHTASERIKFQGDYHYKAVLSDHLHAFIGPSAQQAISPASYGTLHDNVSFTNRSINTSLEVGRINGKTTVSPSGGAGYSIPIELPQGTNGLGPTLSLEYNSHNSVGIAGLGWEISGLSSIYRVSKTIYNDNIISSVRFDNNDAFALDGNRLILTSGTNGNDGATYATETETFSRVMAKGNLGGGPNWFQIETKDGLLMEYGKTSDSKHLLNGINSVATWSINKVIDNFGNSYTYHYRLENNEVLLHKIVYADNVIVFDYSERSDKNALYVSGSSKQYNVLLESIRILSSNKLVAKYKFNYAFEINSYLTEITKFASNGNALNSTLFKYGESVFNVTEETVNNTELLPTNSNATDAEYWSGDYNGDGKTDLIALSYGLVNVNAGNGQYYLAKNWLDWTLKINQGNNTYVSYTPQSFPSGFQPGDNLHSINTGNIGNSSLRNFDINGDGLEDIIFTLIEPYDAVYDNYVVYPYLSNGTSFSAQPSITRKVIKNQHQQLFVGRYTHRQLDLNGDGKQDLLSHNQSVIGYPNGSTASRVDIIFDFDETNTNNILNATVNGDYVFSNPNGASSFPMDINGDGKTELVDIYNNNDMKYYYLELINNQFVFTQQVERIGDNLNNPHAIYADFNKDGKMDVLNFIPQLTPSSTYSWEMRHSNGNGFTSTNLGTFLGDPNKTMSNDNEELTRFAVDMNGDWRNDIVEIKSTRPNSSTTPITVINVYYSNGVDFVKKTYPSSHYIDPSSDEIEFGDFNGDGKVDIHFHEFGYALGLGTTHTVYYFQKDKKESLLHGVLDGFNNEISIVYDNLTNPSIYTKGNNTINDVLDIQFTMPVVSQIKKPDGIGGDYITTYSYEGAKIHTKGKGFLGFDKIVKENQVSGIRTTSTYQVDPTYFINNKIEEKKELMSSNELLFETDFQYTYSNRGGKCVFPFVDLLTEVNHLTSHVTTTDNTYDNNGNITSIIITKGNLETTTITNAFQQYGTWIPSSLTSTTITKTRQGNASSYVRTTSYTYNSDGSIDQKIEDPGDAKSVTTSYQYNSMGNKTKVTTVGSGITLTENFFFDPLGKYPIQKTNDKGQSSFIQYNSRFGLPVEEIGVDGLVTKYQYDGQGRLITKIKPNRVKEVITYSWSVGSGGSGTPTTVDNDIYTVTTVQPGAPSEKVWYDSFERERKKETEGFSQKIYQVTSYDARGNIKSKTTPFEVGGLHPAIVTTYSYDDYNQLETVANSAGTKSITYSYSTNGVSSTETFPNFSTKTKVIDPTGKLISSTENSSGTLTYTYYASGLQKEVKLNGSTIISSAYDTQGHQTQLIDVNAGTSNYFYSAFGELLSQTDNKGTTTFQYNDHNELYIKTTPESSITYEYYQNGNGINQLKSVINTNGSESHYSYDKYGRLTKNRVILDGEEFNYKYTYDLFGRKLSETFPSGFSVANEYTTYGYLSKKRNQGNGGIIWEGSSMNAFGQYLTVSKGLHTTTYEYDAYGLPTEQNGQLDLSYTFESSTGNLTQRKDNTHNVFEDFEYDNQDRLKKMSLNGINDRTISFKNNGNIERKDEITQYKYLSARPNALESVEDHSDIIANTQQIITYNSFHQPQSILEGNSQLDLEYDSDGHRYSSKLKTNGTLIRTRYYLPNYEKQIIETTNKTQLIHYLHGGDGLAAIYVIENGVGTFYHTYTDYLGSILKVIDISGNTVAEQSFDAWGRRRNISDWTYSTIAGTPDWLYRGFTGHEHYDEFVLINMNGRMYDPILGRMLSVDNFVQDATSVQGFNRYTYAMNNPMKFTDPNGELAWFVLPLIGLFVGGYIGGAIAAGDGGLRGANWNPFGGKKGSWKGTDWYKGAVIGGVIGAAVGLGATAILSNSAALTGTPWQIKGIYASHATTGGSTTFGYSSISNAIITSNVNVFSSFLQGRSQDEVFLSALSGFVAGFVGGAVGNMPRFDGSSINGVSLQSIRATNYTTSILNGGLDRYTNSRYHGDRGGQLITNTIFGALEGAYGAYLGSGSKIANLPSQGIPRFAGRYISSIASSAITSYPGLSVTIASYHGSYLSALGLGSEGALAIWSGFGFMGTAPPFYGYAINRFIYTSARISPFGFLPRP
jgi:RHS repeat-associated protein